MKTILAGLYSTVVLAAVIPFGLVDATPFAAVAICMFALSVAALLLFGEPRRAHWVFVWVLLLFIVTSAWIVIQTIRIPWPSLINPIWKDANALAGASRDTISVAPADTLTSLLYIALPVMTFLTGLIVADTDKRARRILMVLAVGAGMISLFGLGQFLLFPKMLLTESKRYYLDSLTAVFVNRNTAATFLGLSFLILATFASENGRAYFGFSSAPSGSFEGRHRLLAFCRPRPLLPDRANAHPVPCRTGRNRPWLDLLPPLSRPTVEGQTLQAASSSGRLCDPKLVNGSQCDRPYSRFSPLFSAAEPSCVQTSEAPMTIAFASGPIRYTPSRRIGFRELDFGTFRTVFSASPDIRLRNWRHCGQGSQLLSRRLSDTRNNIPGRHVPDLLSCSCGPSGVAIRLVVG